MLIMLLIILKKKQNKTNKIKLMILYYIKIKLIEKKNTNLYEKILSLKLKENKILYIYNLI